MEELTVEKQRDIILNNLKNEKDHPLYNLYLDLVLGGPKKLQSILAVHSSFDENDNEVIEEEILEKVVSGTSLQYFQIEDSLTPKIQFKLLRITLEFVKLSRLILIRSLKHCGNLQKLIIRNVELSGECDMIITLPKLTHYTWFDVKAGQDLDPLYKNGRHPMWFFNITENDKPCLASFWKKGFLLDFQSSDLKLKIDREKAYFQCGGISWSHRYEIEQSYLNELLSYLQVSPKVFKLQNLFLTFNPILRRRNKPVEIKELELRDLKLEKELFNEILISCSESIGTLTLANSWRTDAESLSLDTLASLKITYLTVKRMEISTTSDIDFTIDKLEHLDIIGCKVPKEFVSNIEKIFPVLRSISIYGCEFGTEKGLSAKALEILMKIDKLRLINIDGSSDNPGFHWGWGTFSQANRQLQTILKTHGSPSYVTSAKFLRVGENPWKYVPGTLP